MASSKAPSNDFAPAWLKIPAQPSTVSPRGDVPSHFGEKQSIGKNWNVDGSYGHPSSSSRGIQRQRSFDARYGEPPPNPNKYRHHSVDGYYDDYYNYGYYDDYYGYQTYPTLNQPQSSKRNNKYQHPNSRPSHEALAHYHYNYPYEHNFADPPFFVAQQPYSQEGLKNERNATEKLRKNKPGKDYFNSEFPTLGKGGTSKPAGSPVKASNGGVWDKPNNKVFSQPTSSTDTPTNCETKESSKTNTHIYKAAVPVRKPITDYVGDISSQHDENQPSLKSSSISKNGNLITTDSNSNKINGVNKENENAKDLVNGVAHLHLKSSPSRTRQEEVFLSSSLEAEQRLLREMGWNEADEEVYEITEDDMLEFQNLSKQVKEQCNGQTKNVLGKSPGKDVPSFAPVSNLPQPANESSEESDLESD